MSARYIAEASPPFGGRPAVARLDAAIDMTLGVTCDNQGQGLRAIGPAPVEPPAIASFDGHL